MENKVETFVKGLNKIKDYLKNNIRYENVVQDYHIAEQAYLYSTSKIEEVVLNTSGTLIENPSSENYIYGRNGSTLIENESNVINALKYIESERKANLGLSTSSITEIYLQVTRGLVFGNRLKKEYTDYLFLKGLTPISYGINNLLTEIEDFYYDNKNELNPIEFAVRVHNLYLKHFPLKAIGNGQTARILLNYILTSNGMKPYNVTTSNIRLYESTVMEDLEFGTDNFYNEVLELKTEEVNNSLEEIRILSKFESNRNHSSNYKDSNLKKVVNSGIK